MNAISYLVLAAALGVDYGWQKSADGQWEYIMQVEPALLETLAEGESLISELPPELNGVRRIVLRVGTSPVPRGRLPDVAQSSGRVTARHAPERGFLNANGQAWPVENEELPDRPRLDGVPFTNHEHPPTHRWTRDAHAGTNRESPILSVPSRVFSSPSKKSAAEITHLPKSDREEYVPFDRQERGADRSDRSGYESGIQRGPLPGPVGDAALDGTARSEQSTRQSHDEYPRVADSRSGNSVLRPTDRNSKSGLNGQSGAANNSQAMTGRTFPTILILFLFASIGGNLYLGWLARDFYWRYRDLAWEMRSNNSSAA